MTCDLFPGDVVYIGHAITLTVLSVLGDLVRFKVESSEGECSGSDMDNEAAEESFAMSPGRSLPGH